VLQALRELREPCGYSICGPLPSAPKRKASPRRKLLVRSQIVGAAASNGSILRYRWSRFALLVLDVPRAGLARLIARRFDSLKALLASTASAENGESPSENSGSFVGSDLAMRPVGFATKPPRPVSAFSTPDVLGAMQGKVRQEVASLEFSRHLGHAGTYCRNQRACRPPCCPLTPRTPHCAPL
jgi:hypothetical protein